MAVGWPGEEEFTALGMKADAIKRQNNIVMRASLGYFICWGPLLVAGYSGAGFDK